MLLFYLVLSILALAASIIVHGVLTGQKKAHG